MAQRTSLENAGKNLVHRDDGSVIPNVQSIETMWGSALIVSGNRKFKDSNDKVDLLEPFQMLRQQICTAVNPSNGRMKRGHRTDVRVFSDSNFLGG